MTSLLVPNNPDPQPIANEPPPQARGASIRPAANPTVEYVSARPNPRIARYVESLPQWIDDVTRDFGTDVYENMLNDSQVYSCVEILKLTVMSEGYEIMPTVENKQANDYEFSKKMADFCKDNIDNLPIPFEQWTYEMLEGLAMGNKLAEKVCRIEADGEHKGRLMLDKLKVKPRKTYSYVVDAFFNILGVVAIIPGRSYIVYQGTTLFAPEQLPNLLPRDKFCIFTFNPKDGDPRGRSVLRPCYDPWWCKLQIKGEYLKYLAQFGSPSIWGTTPEDATGELATDDVGNVVSATAVLSPEEKQLAALQMLRNGSCASFPFGSSVNVLQASQGAGFLDAFAFYDKQIAKAILGQTLATEEGEHQARAAAETHKDVLDMVMQHVRRSIETMVRNDIFRFLIRYNFGEEAARLYTPKIRFGREQKTEWATDVASVASLAGAGLLAADQMHWVDEKLNMPAREGKSLYEKNLEQPAQPGQPGQPSSSGSVNSSFPKGTGPEGAKTVQTPANSSAVPLSATASFSDPAKCFQDASSLSPDDPSSSLSASTGSISQRSQHLSALANEFRASLPELTLAELQNPVSRSRLSFVDSNLLRRGKALARSFSDSHGKKLHDVAA